jgi:UDP-glucose 4-epimerase
VIEAAQRVTGCTIKAVDAHRRVGDPNRLVADATQAKKILGWQPRFADLDKIVAHS